jgi:hypothetical protein
MPLGAVLFYNGVVACGAVLWFHFWDSFLQRSKCRILTQKALKCKNYTMCREKDKRRWTEERSKKKGDDLDPTVINVSDGKTNLN